MIVSEPPFSILRAAPKKRFGFCNALASTPPLGYEGQAISASVLGGAVMGTGSGTAVGAFLGAFFIGVLNNGMTLLRLSTYWQDVVRGCVIFGVVMISVMSSANKNNRSIFKKKGKAESTKG